eukprot:9326425-Pyramimonas_sp.AAC.1
MQEHPYVNPEQSRESVFAKGSGTARQPLGGPKNNIPQELVFMATERPQLHPRRKASHEKAVAQNIYRSCPSITDARQAKATPRTKPTR